MPQPRCATPLVLAIRVPKFTKFRVNVPGTSRNLNVFSLAHIGFQSEDSRAYMSP